MSLTKLKLNENSVVIGMRWANLETDKAGFTDNDGYTVYQINQDEIDRCVINHTKVEDGHLITDVSHLMTGPSQSQQQLAQVTYQQMMTTQDVTTLQTQNAQMAYQLMMIQRGGEA